jgi:ATP-binding cassette subfamily B protein
MSLLQKGSSKAKNNNSGHGQLTLKERLAALRNLPRFFTLVWKTSRQMTIINALLRIIKSATPLAILYVGKLIIDEVIHISEAKGNISSRYLWTFGSNRVWAGYIIRRIGTCYYTYG